jgi:hypothetical protein
VSTRVGDPQTTRPLPADGVQARQPAGRHRVAASGGATAAAGRPRRSAAALRPIVALAIGVAALLLRLFHIRTAEDLFVDELTYAKIARSVAAGHGADLDGQPFFLHPPAFFHELAFILRIDGTPASLTTTILELRAFDAVAGAIGVAFVTAILLRLTRLPVAVAAGLILAVDPFLNRFDSRLLLEAPAMAAASAAIFILGGPARSRREALVRGIGAGLLLALSATTKDLYVFVGAIPVAVAAVVFHGYRRVCYGLAALTAVCGYGAYVLSVVINGQGRAFLSAKTVGLDRVLGRTQETGFNKAGNPSLVSRLFANSGTDIGSYVLIGLGVLSTLALLVVAFRRRGIRALPVGTVFVGIWSAGAIVLLSYEVTLGTLEEQMFYPLLVVSVVALAVAVDLAWARRRPDWQRVTFRVVAVALAAGILIADSAAWGEIHTRRDDAYVQFLAWQQHGMKPSATQPVPVVAATEDLSQFLMTGVIIGQWATPAQLVAHHVDYVVLATTLVEQGYGEARPPLEQLLNRVAPIVYQVTAPTTGQLRVYDVRDWVYAQTHPAAPVRGPR